MALKKYVGAAEFYARGKLLAEATRLTVTDTSNDRPVMTMIGGMSGFSDGPPTAEASIESAIPKAGMEFDFRDAVDKKETFTIVHVCAGVRRTYEGRLSNVTTSQSVDSAASVSASFTGRRTGGR